MSDELEDIVENLREPATWIRVLFMLGFAIGFYLVLVPIIALLALVQALFSVIGGEPNDNLQRFGKALTLYVTEILQFLFYNRQEKPFPFSSFPVEESDADDPAGDPPPGSESAASPRSTQKSSAEGAAASNRSQADKGASFAAGSQPEKPEPFSADSTQMARPEPIASDSQAEEAGPAQNNAEYKLPILASLHHAARDSDEQDESTPGGASGTAQDGDEQDQPPPAEK